MYPATDMKPSSSDNQAHKREESELVQRLAAGDGKAFELLFKTYAQQLITFAHRFVADLPVAENLVQDVFLKIWSNRANLKPDSNIKTYLYTAVRNQALHHLRHLKVERKHAEGSAANPATEQTPQTEIEAKEIEQHIQQAIAALPEKCRIIFSMNRFDHLTYSEIAEIQNISVKTVETQMGRALKFLRQRLLHFLAILPF